MQGAPSPQSAAQQQQQQQQDALADDFLEGHPRYTQVRPLPPCSLGSWWTRPALPIDLIRPWKLSCRDGL